MIFRGQLAHLDCLLLAGHGHNTVIHVAVNHVATLSIIQTLVSEDDRVLLVYNSFGEDGDDTQENMKVNTPLHSALKHQAEFVMLYLLVDVDKTV